MKIKRITALLLTAVLLCLPCMAFAVSADEVISTTEMEPQRVSEVENLRTESSETYLLSDGTYECVVFAEDKYYMTASGEYAEIDNTIVAASQVDAGVAYAYSNAANAIQISFTDNGMAGVLIEKGNSSIAFMPVDANLVTPSIGGSSEFNAAVELSMTGSNCIIYEGIYPQTDIMYVVENNILKEYIILKDSTAPTEFVFEFTLTGCTAEQGEDGLIAFYDNAGGKCFELASLFAIDNVGAYTEELHYTLTELDDGCYAISVEIADEFMQNPERVFPIVIDPSVMVTGTSTTYDTFVSSLYPSSNYYLNNYLRTGKDTDYGVRRSLIKFSIPSFLSDCLTPNVSSAYLRIRKYAGVDPTTVKVYRATSSWSSSSVTWSNMPGYDSAGSGYLTAYSGDWYQANVTTLIRGWVTGTSSVGHYGFLLKDVNESDTSQWTMFYSSDAPSPNKPELHIYFAENQYLSYGYPSATIPVKVDGGYDIYNTRIRQAMTTWNNSGSGVTFTENSSANNVITVNSTKLDAKEYGVLSPNISGSTLTSFTITIYSIRIGEVATSIDNFYQSVIVHELGHAIWLEDNPTTPDASIMKYSRDRNTMTEPSSYDITNVAAKY